MALRYIHDSINSGGCCTATICRNRHYMSQTPLYVAKSATICRNRHYMSQNLPLYVATLNVARKSKINTICRKKNFECEMEF